MFLFPSTYDTNGIVVREAAACGLASVLISGSCAAEGITHGRNGYLCEETGESIAALLSEIAGSPERMHEVGQNAMDEIYISWEESVMQALDRYQTVLEMKHAGTLKPRRNGKSDKFLSATADVMEAFYHILHMPKALHDSIQDNLYGMQENFAEAEKRLHEFHENVRETRNEIKEELKEEWNKMNGSKK